MPTHNRCTLLFLVMALPIALQAQAPITTLQNLQLCFDGQLAGYTTVCPLAPGAYLIDGSASPQLHIRRNSVTFEGTGTSASQTILRRANSSVVHLLSVDNSVSGVTIQDLEFDGNRFGISGLQCLPGNSAYWDVDLSYAGTATLNIVNNADFYNAPATALEVGGYTAVIYSTFLNARSTALMLGGSYSGAWYNTFTQSGTAAINVRGQYQEIYGNTLSKNRYEQSDNNGGGQFFVDPSSTYASVAANVIDGYDWVTPYPPTLVNGCSVTGGLWVQGVEAYGMGHRFFNNEVVQNSAAGMNIGAAGVPASNILVSSTNPWSGSDTPRYVEQNEIGGIAFLGDATTGLTLDHVRSRNNLRSGVYLQGATGPGFINNACIQGNGHDDCGADICEYTPYLNNQYPANSNVCP
jgi:hypothetical protein